MSYVDNALVRYTSARSILARHPPAAGQYVLCSSSSCVRVKTVQKRARAPPLLEAVHVDPLDGAAAGARLHEQAFVFIPPAHHRVGVV